MEDVVAALPQRGLGTKVCNDVHQAVAQALYGLAIRYSLQQAQRIHIATNVVHQLTYTHAHHLYVTQSAKWHVFINVILSTHFDAWCLLHSDTSRPAIDCWA